MSDSIAALRRKISSAGDLQSVVRTMKALAASSIGQYEKSVRALGDYYHTVELGLGACLRQTAPAGAVPLPPAESDASPIGAIVFGSDQGLVGQFNDIVADYAIKTLAALSGEARVWAVGERVHARLADAGLSMLGLFAVPNSVQAIAPLVGRIQIESEARRVDGSYAASMFSIIARDPGRCTIRSASGCCRWTPNGSKVWPKSPGRPNSRRKSWEAAPRRSAPSFVNTFSSRSSGPAPNLSPAKTPAGSPRCSAPTRTSTTCSRRSRAPSTACARPRSTRNSST